MTDPANLIARNLEEVLTRDDLNKLVESGTPLRHYIGFEISGKIHLGTGLVCMGKVKDFVDPASTARSSSPTGTRGSTTSSAATARRSAACPSTTSLRG
jgi:hypothetical protein